MIFKCNNVQGEGVRGNAFPYVVREFKMKCKRNHSTFDAVMLFMFLSLGCIDWEHTPIKFSAVWVVILCIMIVFRRLYDEYS